MKHLTSLQKKGRGCSFKCFHIHHPCTMVVFFMSMMKTISPLANLVCIHKHDLLHSEREQHIQKEDLVAPDEPLFLCLCVKPSRPLVLNQLVLKPILLCHVWDEILRRKKRREGVRKEEEEKHKATLYPHAHTPPPISPSSPPLSPPSLLPPFPPHHEHLKYGGEVVLEKPELDRIVSVFEHTEHHNPRSNKGRQM